MHAEHADCTSLNTLSGRVIGCAFTVLNALGAGFLEKVYENALAREFTDSDLRFRQQHGFRVEYKGGLVGEYCVDFLVEGQLLVELKAIKALDDVHRLQCVNYLRAANLPLCLLLNFGRPRLEIRRVANRL